MRRVKADLEKRGHDVWFDKNEIKAGDDWRRAITEGIVSSNRVLSFLSKHSTRDPGVCLDEIAIAIGAKGGNIQTILVESQDEVNPPSTISHIQWLDMHDWKDGHGAVQIAKGEPAKGEAAWEAWYQERFAEIVRVVESPENVRFAGEIEKLKGFLKPISSEARIFQLLNKDFVGRQWLVKAVEEWRTTDNPSRLFWITGSPGVGKSAFSAFLAHQEKHKIVAVQFCEYDKPDHRNPVRIVCTLAFQLATRLPDYRKLLMDLPELDKLSEKSESELFSYLLANPLKHVIHGGRERCLILIDALDEASEGSRNPLVELLARHADALPEWLGIVVTSRPETSVTGPLSMYNPLVLDTGTEANHTDLAEYLKLKLATQLAGRTDADAVIDHLITQSEGVFLYAEWVCRDVVQQNLSLDHLDQFPKGLGGIFRQFFARQFPDQTVYEQTIEPVLGAILAAREPLPIELLQELFVWRETELRKWLRILGALFPVTTENGVEVIKPWHKSVPDWLSDANQSLEYFVEVSEGHRRLAELGWNTYKCSVHSMGQYLFVNTAFHLAYFCRWDDLAQLILDKNYLKRHGKNLSYDRLCEAFSWWINAFESSCDLSILSECAATQDDLQLLCISHLTERDIKALRIRLIYKRLEEIKGFFGREYAMDLIESAIENDHRLLISGTAGTGKTWLLTNYSVVHHENMLYLHKIRSYKRDEIRAFTIGLAIGLTQTFPEYLNWLKCQRPEFWNFDLVPSREMFDSLILYPLYRIIPTSGCLVIGIDGLDECTLGAETASMIDFVSHINLPGSLRLVVATRLTFDIQEKFANWRNIDIDKLREENEVEKYVEFRLAKPPIGLLDKKIKAEIINKLCKASDGSIFYAAHIVNKLESGELDPDKYLNTDLTLSGYILRSFQTRAPNIANYRDMILPLLRVVCETPKMISIEEAASILGKTEAEISSCIASINPILEISLLPSRNCKLIRPFHGYLATWLGDPNQSKAYSFAYKT